MFKYLTFKTFYMNNEMNKNKNKKNITIIGSGWGCSSFIKYINMNKYNVTVISDNNKFLYTPLLTNNIFNNIDIEENITDINHDINFIKDNVLDIDFDKNQITTTNNTLNYDNLILSHGADINTYNIPGVKEYCYFIKNKEDIYKIKNKLNELNNDINDNNSIDNNRNISIIGSGLTGTELVGNLIDENKYLIDENKYSINENKYSINENKYSINVIDILKRPLSMFHINISNHIIELWDKNNVNMYFNNKVQKIDNDYIYLTNTKIPYDMSIWCGGLKPSELTIKINNKLNNNTKLGIPINDKLNVKYSDGNNLNQNNLNQNNLIYPNIYAIGDCTDSIYPSSAQVAYQQGKYLATNFNKEFKNIEPFQFNNKGMICYIGNHESVYQYNKFKMTGTFTYYMNNILHIYNSINMNQSFKLLFNNTNNINKVINQISIYDNLI
jgi:NADH dehydrogenase FAD-containing subunit